MTKSPKTGKRWQWQLGLLPVGRWRLSMRLHVAFFQEPPETPGEMLVNTQNTKIVWLQNAFTNTTNQQQIAVAPVVIVSASVYFLINQSQPCISLINHLQSTSCSPLIGSFKFQTLLVNTQKKTSGHTQENMRLSSHWSIKNGFRFPRYQTKTTVVKSTTPFWKYWLMFCLVIVSAFQTVNNLGVVVVTWQVL